MFESGKKVLLRTVTYHQVGEVDRVEDGWVYLRRASWVADSGRFGEALKSGELAEVELVGEVAVNLSTVVDAFPWEHALPTESR